MLIKSEQLSVGSLIKNVMLKYLFWASYILRLCAQTCTPNRHALRGEGEVPRPAPSRKNDQNRGEVPGQNKGLNLKFLQ